MIYVGAQAVGTAFLPKAIGQDVQKEIDCLIDTSLVGRFLGCGIQDDEFFKMTYKACEGDIPLEIRRGWTKEGVPGEIKWALSVMVLCTYAMAQKGEKKMELILKERERAEKIIERYKDPDYLPVINY